jgi:hypothetical protein
MKAERAYRDRCAARGLDEAAIGRALTAVRALESEVEGHGGVLEEAGLPEVETHVASIAASGEAAEERIMALARYFAVASSETVAIRLLAYLLPIGVLPAMAQRLAELEGEATKARVMAGIEVPRPGSPPEAYPAATAAFVRALERELGPARARRVLAWNVHEIPASAFDQERERFLAAPSVGAWLADYHERQVAILAKHAADGTLWFEQRITRRVVDYVRSQPEIQGGVVEGDRIYTTKIPYDPDRFLATDDPLEKRRLACHCPLAASTIGADGAGVPALWCACSAGYTKFIFDVVFGKETEAEVLESVLAGDRRCRFAIRIPKAVIETKTL